MSCLAWFKRLIFVVIFGAVAVQPSLAEAAWGDLLCGISNGSPDAFKKAVELYNLSDDSERQCKTAIVFNAKQKITVNERIVIDRLPPDGLNYGFAIRKCIPSGPYADPMPCPELANTDVELDFSGMTEDNGDCPILIKADAKIDFRRLKLIVKNVNKAVCTYTNKTNIAKDSDNNPNNNNGNPLDNYAWIANDVTITDVGGIQPQPPTCDIGSAVSGNGFDITWTSSGATSVSVKAGSTEISDEANGTEHVSPSGKTTYTIVATNAAGECTDSVTVTPTPVVTAPTCQLTTTDLGGGDHKLEWQTTNATTVTLDDGSGPADVAATGEQTVHPAVTTVYTLHAANTAGSCEDTVVVTVTPTIPPAPTCDLTSAASGDGYDLTWTSTNGTTASLSDGTTTLSTDLNSGAPIHVTPAAATTYTLTITGAGGTCSRAVTLSPSGSTPTAPTCDLTAVVAADGFDLTWTSTNGTTASLSDGTTTLSTDLNSAAPLHVTPAAPTTYTLTITGTGGTCSKAVLLTPGGAVPAAPTCTLTSAAGGDGFDLTWTSTNGTTASLSDGTTTLSTDLNSAAPLHVTPLASTTYTLAVTGSGGSCSRAVTLAPSGGVGPAPTCTLNAAAASGGFDLTWTSTNGTTASLSDGATTLSTDLNSAAAVHVTPSSSTTYTLTVNGAGGQVCSRAVTLAPGVVVGAAPTCALNSATASGGGFDLTWTTTNATTVSLKEGSTSLATDANSSSAVHVNPSTPTAYTLEASGSGGSCKWITTLGPASSGSGSSGSGTDTDGDGIPDDIETNTFGTDPANPDSDGDGVNDGAEVQSPFFPACGPTDPDCDDDGVCDGPNTVKDTADNVICAPVSEGHGDNCPLVSNGPNTAEMAPEDFQKDSDGDGVGDLCQGDMDGDTVEDASDNCAFIPNEKQEDSDANGIGDACDPGFSVSPGGGGCGCRIEGPASKSQASLAFLALGIPLILLRAFRKRGTN